MPDPSLPLPQRPDEVAAAATVDELLQQYDQYSRHLFALVWDRPGAPRVPDEELARRAVAALALAEAIVANLASERWRLVRDALLYGATIDEVGAALSGLEPDEIATAIVAWADRRLAGGVMDAAEHADALDLVGRGDR